MESSSKKAKDDVKKQIPDAIQNTSEETPTSTTCLGCEQGVFNQLGHMDEGGCLYDPDY